MNVKELKKAYLEKCKKYSLPDFDKMNQDFDLEKIKRESYILLRGIRKIMTERISQSMSFLEMLMNPVNAPRMYFNYIKTIGVEEKKKLDDMHAKLVEATLISFECEMDYDEKEEAKAIKKTFDIWQELKPGFKEIFKKVRNPVAFSKKDRGYFG
jgi:hypothetical protein